MGGRFFFVLFFFVVFIWGGGAVRVDVNVNEGLKLLWKLKKMWRGSGQGGCE